MWATANLFVARSRNFMLWAMRSSTGGTTACDFAFRNAASNISSRSSGPNSQSPPATWSLVSTLLRGPRRACDDVLLRVEAHSDVALTLTRWLANRAPLELCWRVANGSPVVLFHESPATTRSAPGPSPANHGNGMSFRNAKETHCTDDPRKSNGRLEQEMA